MNALTQAASGYARDVATLAPLPDGLVGDPGRLRQVIVNLVGNAIKYGGKESPVIHIAAERDGAMWVCSVRDNGIGLDAELLQGNRLFEVFAQAESAHRRVDTLRAGGRRARANAFFTQGAEPHLHRQAGRRKRGTALTPTPPTWAG